MEFPHHQPKPAWFAIEQFIAERDDYGAGFVKHNTNSGFVDKEERCRMPQVFLAFSFYNSKCTMTLSKAPCLVALNLYLTLHLLLFEQSM